MNKQLIFIGVVCSLLWLFVTKITSAISSVCCVPIGNTVFPYYDNIVMGIFTVLFFIVFALSIFLFLKIEKGFAQKHSLAIILFFSIVFRIILLPAAPLHENDIYRYLWDGKTFLNQINPYKYAPADLLAHEGKTEKGYGDSSCDHDMPDRTFTEEEGEQIRTLIKLKNENPLIFERIGHKHVPTVYPPLIQCLFALSVWIKQDSILVMKTIFVLFDMGVIFLIISLLKHFKKDPCLCLLYGWSPLVLREIAHFGHYDSVVVFFVLLSLQLFINNRKGWVGVSLALATLIKFFPVVMLPILWRGLKGRDVLFYCLILIGAFIPFVIMGHTGLNNLFQGFLTYNRYWSYNSSIFALVYAFIKKLSPILAVSIVPAKMAVGCIYAGIVYFLVKNKKKGELDIVYKCFVAISTLFILSPVGDPWYFCWVMPFLCIFPFRSWILLSALLVLSCLNFRFDIVLADSRFFNISANVVVLSIFAGIIYFLLRGQKKRNLEIIYKCFFSIAVLFIVSPEGNPWYFYWAMLLFLCAFWYRSWSFFIGLLIIAYLNIQFASVLGDMQFCHTPAFNWLIYVPFFSFFYFEKRKKGRYYYTNLSNNF
ncbi:MAG: glycosyltransferase 87 family protein [Candidatus Scalindua sp.]